MTRYESIYDVVVLLLYRCDKDVGGDVVVVVGGGDSGGSDGGDAIVCCY